MWKYCVGCLVVYFGDLLLGFLARGDSGEEGGVAGFWISQHYLGHVGSVSLPITTLFLGRLMQKLLTSAVHMRQKRKRENNRRKDFMINLHEGMLPTPQQSNPRCPDHQSDAHRAELRLACGHATLSVWWIIYGQRKFRSGFIQLLCQHICVIAQWRSTKDLLRVTVLINI